MARPREEVDNPCDGADLEEEEEDTAHIPGTHDDVGGEEEDSNAQEDRRTQVHSHVVEEGHEVGRDTEVDVNGKRPDVDTKGDSQICCSSSYH